MVNSVPKSSATSIFECQMRPNDKMRANEVTEAAFLEQNKSCDFLQSLNSFQYKKMVESEF
jgi:hypothetical protein